ncbi:MAG: ATP-binding cassette domain-containing protein, partial [SAR202 cluster bacterium]|nr:ATP-binding cassette domain-containing protein [SAR202 cluster bacterium]
MSLLLELKGVRKQYADADGAHIEILRGVDLQVAAGESVAIIGASGCGKSTLLNLIGTLDRPDAGEILLNGKSLAAATDG